LIQDQDEEDKNKTKTKDHKTDKCQDEIKTMKFGLKTKTLTSLQTAYKYEDTHENPPWPVN